MSNLFYNADENFDDQAFKKIGEEITLQEEFIQQEVLNEEYFGQHPEMKKIENLLNPICDPKTSYIIPSKFIGKVQEEVQHCFERAFNVKKVRLGVMKTTDGPNAYCVPCYKMDTMTASDFLKSIEITKDKHGYRFKEKRQILVLCIFNQLLGKSTPREFIAIMLHEVGHAFADMPMTSKFYLGVQKLLYGNYFDDALKNTDVTVQNKKDIEKKNLEKYDKELDSNSILQEFFSLLIRCLLIVGSYFFHGGGKIIEFLKGGIPFSWLLNAFLKFTFDTQSLERFSDNFAASYGYAIEQRSSLLKMYKDNDRKRHKSAVNFFVCYSLSIVDCVFSPFSSHPNVLAREDETYAYLKRQIEHTKDKKLKKEVEQQIKYMRDTSIEIRTKHLSLFQVLRSLYQYPFDLLLKLWAKIIGLPDIERIDKEIKNG